MKLKGIFLALVILLLPVTGFSTPTHQLNVGTYTGNTLYSSQMNGSWGGLMTNYGTVNLYGMYNGAANWVQAPHGGGHWRLNDLKTTSILKDKSFHFEETLANGGYIELVNQLATLLEQLCSEIAQSRTLASTISH